MIAPHDMDFETGSRDAVEEVEEPPRNVFEKFWRYVYWCCVVLTTRTHLSWAAGSCKNGVVWVVISGQNASVISLHRTGLSLELDWTVFQTKEQSGEIHFLDYSRVKMHNCAPTDHSSPTSCSILPARLTHLAKSQPKVQD